jgi:hypothetical protein
MAHSLQKKGSYSMHSRMADSTNIFNHVTMGLSCYHWNAKSEALAVIQWPRITPITIRNQNEQHIQPVGD